MWDNHRSLVLSQLSVALFSVLLLIVVVSAPWLVGWLISSSRAYLQGTEWYFLATIYAGCIPAGVTLYSLFRLLQHIATGQVFMAENVEYLRRISWGCIVGATVSAVSAFYYFPWVLVAIAAGFMALIVRVVKNVVAQAVALKDEVDYTV